MPNPEPTPSVTDPNDDGWDDELDDRDDLECTHCGGSCMQENDDPLWHGFDVVEIPCEACGGTGLRKHQTVF
jgi:DnaJ-class molecular chaperone